MCGYTALSHKTHALARVILLWHLPFEIEQYGPPIGGAVRNATSLIPQWLSYIMLAITFSENVRALPCINSHGRIDRNNNTTSAIYVMHRSI